MTGRVKIVGTHVWISVVGAVVCASLGAALIVNRLGDSPAPAARDHGPSVGPVEAQAPEAGDLAFRRLADPSRTVVLDSQGTTLAVFTDGARTVQLSGPARTFKEPAFTTATVTSNAWVRLAPREWREGAETDDWFRPWLDRAMTDRSPDALGVAMEYVYGAPPKRNADGLQISGDASFGPLSKIDPDGRAENSDFYDYLGVSWSFSDGKKEKPSPAHLHSLDCSGFLRMVYGYRLGYPLRGTNTEGVGLPRQAYAIAAFGPGVQLMPNRGTQARELDRLQPGDLLFFNAGPITGAHIEHSGIYLGLDSRGHHRFISSRSYANGPTLGDMGGESLLDGSGYWATRFRTARRV